MPEQGGQGEAKGYTESGTKEAKGGEEMKINREDVVQAALNVERWCKEHENGKYEDCDCPFAYITDAMAQLCMLGRRKPKTWSLEEQLRTRGLEHDD